MNYHEAMHTHPDGRCPFCHLKDEEIIKEYTHFVVIPTRAPYCEDHLLIIPKEHDILLHEMPHQRHIEMYKIVDERTERLHKQHKDITLMLRDGKVGGHTGKSQDHVHFHLIPDYDLGGDSSQNENLSINRKFFEEDEYVELVKKIQNRYLPGD